MKSSKWLFLKTFATCSLLLPVTGYADELPHFPALNPPRIENENPTNLLQQAVAVPKAAMEWTYHKSPDGSHPDGHEQQIMWLMNNARQNPAAEGTWLATETGPDVAGGRTYFNVDLDALRNEFSLLQAKPPAAFDIRLYNAAQAHSLDLIARDAQDHTGQINRVYAAGFHFSQFRGSVFSYADSGLNAHAAWNIDWGGSDGTGMQTGRGHRMATMSADGNYTNVGIAAVSETDSGTKVGPRVTTGNYVMADTGYTDHFNVFIVGTVWQDKNRNQRYDPGEGVGGVTVRPDNGSYFAVTSNSGGYAIPTSAGSYTVTFNGGTLNGSENKSITVNQESVLLDLIPGSGSSPVPPVETAAPLPAIYKLLLPN